MRFRSLSLGVLAALAATVAGTSLASSHREAPFIATSPKADGTDFYMFRSYEAIMPNGTGGRSDYVTVLANYQPLQDAYGGPNYFSMDPNALYEIHIDNNGDAKEDLTFQFRFKNTLKNTALNVNGKQIAIPLIQSGAVSGLNSANLNLNETYSLTLVRGDRRAGAMTPITKTGGSAVFEKPVDYIGTKTLGDAAAYATYANLHIHNITIPGCAAGTNAAKVFVGQRQEGFAVNLGTIFDLVNAPAGVLLDPSLINAQASRSIQNKNVTTLALEIHKDCLASAGDPVIGGWTSASLRQARLLSGAPASGHQATEKTGGAWTQVSRLGNPLVNEVVIGLKDKDKFNASKPAGDTQFLDYVTNPTLPPLLSLVLGADVTAKNTPRTDLATVFLTGIVGVNKPATVTPSEMLRLNTSALPKQYGDQNRLGIVGNILAGGTDGAGFPNGRRPKDDVVDIALVAMVGGLCVANGNSDTYKFNSIPGVTGVTSACNPSAAPLGADSFKIHDAVDQGVVPFLTSFPYLNTPNAGAQ
ncbi:MAG: DUF4331 domain-containing protein [Comamonadaceae bacterium]|nr:MAG: DUF4331 domain-containing protein [Comamonadaceae bacterium]